MIRQLRTRKEGIQGKVDVHIEKKKKGFSFFIIIILILEIRYAQYKFNIWI